MNNEIISLNGLLLTLFPKGRKNLILLVANTARLLQQIKPVSVTSALNACVVSLFQADTAGYAATISQAPGVVLEGLARIFTCFGPYLFFPLRRN